MNLKRPVTIGLFSALAAVILDQAHKWLMLDVIDIHNRPPIEVLPFFDLVMVWNRGISFGMFSDHNQPLVLIGISFLIILMLTFWLVRTYKPWPAAALGIVIGGALGNVIDRARFGAVADFFDFHLMGYHWPAFNIADACIFIGVVVLCIDSMLETKKLNEVKD